MAGISRGVKKMKKKDYVAVIYDEKRTPRTDYPFKLASYLIDRFKLKKEEKILELGCGRGEFLEAFSKLGLACYGVDRSEYGVKNVSDYKFVRVDISKEVLPYPDNYFDVVYHKSLLEHLYSPDHLMKETFRVLRPEGKVIILTPDWESQMRVFYEDFTHSRPYNTTALEDLLKISGFSNVQVELFYQLPVIWKYPWLKMLSRFLGIVFSTPMARKITKFTGIKFFRWSVELMVLGAGVKTE